MACTTPDPGVNASWDSRLGYGVATMTMDEDELGDDALLHWKDEARVWVWIFLSLVVT
jgi:hypothetical protein